MSIKEHPPHSGPNETQIHVPVLLEATVRELSPVKGESYLDLTAGYGGHARAILSKTEAVTSAVLVDRDPNTANALEDLTSAGATLLQTDFLSAVQQLVDQKQRFDIVLADLGVSSPQLDQSERGFSFRFEADLDMRMDSRQSLTAAEIANTASRQELVNIIKQFGEEPLPQARKIADAIIQARPITKTTELAEVISGITSRYHGKIHPATRTFQALRIAVNQELTQVSSMLELLPKLLNPGGRVGIISFHSLEDRLVKRYFAMQQALGYEAQLQTQTKKPIRGKTEDVHNPRSRSASLRVAVKK